MIWEEPLRKQQQLLYVIEAKNVRLVSELCIEGFDERLGIVFRCILTHFKITLGLVSLEDVQVLLEPVNAFSSAFLCGYR